MSFQINCPNCGRRPVWELHYGGPVLSRPETDADRETWTAYLYNRANLCGVQREWWYHRSGCKCWFVVDRDTQTHEVVTARRYEPKEDAGV